uniref:Uncharacterized protein n=1 Tax=Fagus sylvatica TaxID=28930 RepID=A0A2N9GC58_FAGSY
MAPGSRGVGAVFVHFSDADSGQTGDAIGEPRVPHRSRSRYLSNAPGLADQLVASRKDSAREGGSCAAYFCKVPDLRKSELGLVRYGPANRGHRSVFGPFEGSFPIGIPAGPDKFLAIREFLVVHECVFFPMCPGSQINLLRVRKTLCASVATSVGKSRNFQQNLISSACFHARGRHSSRCRIPTILVSSESLHYLLFNGTGLAQRRAWVRKISEVNLLPKGLGSRIKLQRVGENLCANVASQMGCFVNNTYQNLAKGGQFDPVFGLVNGPVKPWSNLVNLGQSSPNSWRCIPDYLKGFWARGVHLPRGSLILHASPPPNPPQLSCAYPFLTRFSRAVLEVFWCLKWVMQHIVGKLSSSSFQRHKVWGAGAVFVCFSGEDSGQTRDATSEPRVPRRSWSRHLSNAPRLAGQLAASRKDSARESGFDLAPGVGIRRSWYRWKACVTLVFKVPDLRGSELGLVRYGPANRGHRSVFGPSEGIFPIEIPARPGKSLAIRELHVVHARVFFPTHLGSRINSLRVKKTLRSSMAMSGGKFRNFQHSLIPSTCFRALHRGELRFARYDPANRGRWNVPHAKGSFSDQDSGLTGGALDDPEVARCS